MKPLYLKKNEEKRIKAGHLWIYSNEVDTVRSPLKTFEPGEIVAVFSSKEVRLATAYINPHALICARVISKKDVPINEDFFAAKFQEALALRQRFFNKPYYRLIFAESDELPGLIIDRFNDIFVVQTNTYGMEKLKEVIFVALIKLFQPQAIILKNDSSRRKMENLDSYVGVAYGSSPNTLTLEENNILFEIPALEGQKTGWFYDHRDNRARLKKYVLEKKVLDVFSYVGGWGIQAAAFGANQVHCIDVSPRAITTLNHNAQLNHVQEKITVQQEDVFIALKKLLQDKQQFDVVVLDPPALIKRRKDLEEGIIAYLRLNELAMQLLTSDGILVSCSCSLHMTQEELLNIIRRASLKTNRSAQILELGLQGMDHPIHPAISETGYLKAFFCRIR